jgi:hypothetical protein
MSPKALPALLLVAAALLACTKDEAVDGSSAANITFRTDSGFVFRNDTVGLGDTLRVGVIVNEGTDALDHFFLSVAYDGGSSTYTDTLEVNTNPFAFQTSLVMRQQAGTEKWTFTVQEPDGDRTLRSLTFLVQ